MKLRRNIIVTSSSSDSDIFFLGIDYETEDSGFVNTQTVVLHRTEVEEIIKKLNKVLEEAF